MTRTSCPQAAHGSGFGRVGVGGCRERSFRSIVRLTASLSGRNARWTIGDCDTPRVGKSPRAVGPALLSWRSHASHLLGVPGLRVDGGPSHRAQDHHGLPLPEVQGRVARAAGRGTDRSVNRQSAPSPPRPIPPARWSAARRLQRACLTPSGAELPFVAGLRHGPHQLAVFESHIQDVSSDKGPQHHGPRLGARQKGSEGIAPAS